MFDPTLQVPLHSRRSLTAVTTDTADPKVEPKFYEISLEFANGQGLPVDIASTVMRLLGTAYPNSQIGPAPHRGGMVFLIPDSDRDRELPAAADLTADPVDPGEIDLTVTDIGSGGVGFSLPKHIAELCLPIVKASFAEFPEAENYLEMKVFDSPTGDRYVLSFARSARQTPGELRRVAEQKHDRLLAELAAAAAASDERDDPDNLARSVGAILARHTPFSEVS